MRAEKKSADAVVAKKRGNARGAKGGRGRASEGTGSEIEGYDNYGRHPESATGRSGGTAASLASAIPRRNFAELLTESNVRELDGRGSQLGELREGLKGGNRQSGSAGDRRDDDGRVERTPCEALAEDPRQAEGGELRTEPREAERNPQRERGRHQDV